MNHETWMRGGPPPARLVRRRLNLFAQLFSLLQPEAAVFAFAEGTMMCPICRDAYRNHARDPRNLEMTMLCDARRVKL